MKFKIYVQDLVLTKEPPCYKQVLFSTELRNIGVNTFGFVRCNRLLVLTEIVTSGAYM